MIEPNLHLIGRRTTRVLRGALWIVALSMPGVEADTIVKTSGQRIEGVEISAARWDQILYKQAGNTFQAPGDTVASVERDSAVVARVRSALESGDYAEAIAQAKRAETGVQGWELAEAQYLVGKIYLRSGKFREAEDAFAAYLKANESTKDYWTPHAVEGRGLAALELNRGGTAQEHFKTLATFGETWTLRATLGEAQGLVLKKEYVEARNQFNKVARDRKAPDSLKAQALVGRANVMVLQEQYDAAIRELQSTFFENPSPELLEYSKARAEASYLMGVCYAKQGGKPNLENAEIWLLRTAVLYRAHASVYSNACKELSSVYKALGRDDRASDWERRAGASG